MHGVHGIAVAPDLNRGFITNGQSNSVTVFDLKTLAKVGEPATGKNPDAVCYDPKTKRVFTMNHSGNDATAIDAKTNEVLSTFQIGLAPEFCAVDGAGKIYVNLETSNEIVEIDAAKAAVARRAQLAPCEGPTGLSIDVKNKKLFPVCGNKVMASDRHSDVQGDCVARHRRAHRRRRLRSRPGARFQRQWRRRHVEHRQAGEWQVRDGGHGHDRTGRAHDGGGRETASRLPAGGGIRPGAGSEGGQEGTPPVLPDSFHILVVGK